MGIPVDSAVKTIASGTLLTDRDSPVRQAIHALWLYERSGSEAQTISAGFRQPILRTPNREFALGLSFDLRHSQTFILDDEPFSFSEGVENGESKVSVLRLSQDWLDRGTTGVGAARSQFSLGLDVFDATVNNTGTDGRFFSWLGQFQCVRQLSPRVVSLVRVNAQLTPDSLLSLESGSGPPSVGQNHP